MIGRLRLRRSDASPDAPDRQSPRGEDPSVATIDRPDPGTWVRLARLHYPMSLWHEVTGWHDGHLELACVDCDRVISWALRPGGEYHVERRPERPPEDACDGCTSDPAGPLASDPLATFEPPPPGSGATPVQRVAA